MRTAGRNEHATTRACPDDSIPIKGFPISPAFFCAFDWLKRADLEFSFQDVEELFRVIMSMCPDIEAGRNQHLET